MSSMTFLRITARVAALAAITLLAVSAFAQVIEYESNGEKYQTLTRRGLTVIIAHLPVQVAGYGLIQISAANGSDIRWTLKPEDFEYVRAGERTTALAAETVVNTM